METGKVAVTPNGATDVVVVVGVDTATDVEDRWLGPAAEDIDAVAVPESLFVPAHPATETSTTVTTTAIR